MKTEMNFVNNSIKIQTNSLYTYKTFCITVIYPNLINGNTEINCCEELKTLYNLLISNTNYKTIYLKYIDSLLNQQIENALFFIDKLATLLNNLPIVIYLLADAYFVKNEFVKVNYLFHSLNLTNYNEYFVILSSQSLINLKHYELALKILLKNNDKKLNNSFLNSQVYYLIGICHKYLENKNDALSNFLKALETDNTNQIAYNELVSICSNDNNSELKDIQNLVFTDNWIWLKDYYKLQSKSIINEEINDENVILLNSNNNFNNDRSDFNKNSPITPKNWLEEDPSINDQSLSSNARIQTPLKNKNPIKNVNSYAKLNDKGSYINSSKSSVIYKHISNISLGSNKCELIKDLFEKNNCDTLYQISLIYFKNFKLNEAYNNCKKILEINFFHYDTLLLFSELLYEKKNINEIFSYSTSLAENIPDHYITFHYFGIYYFISKKFENARIYFNKAIQLNKECLQSWLMLGHSFANQEESEQAMNIYRTALRLFPNSPYPHIYLGMEYIRVSNLKTALLSFRQAKSLCKSNPIIYNEIGCIFLKEKNFTSAKKSFIKAIKLCEENNIDWLKHTILNNLGHTHRKFKEYKLAIECFEQSLTFLPDDPATIFSNAFCYHLSGNVNKAMTLYHKVLTMKYDYHFVNQMLSSGFDDYADKNLQNLKQIIS